MIRERPKDRHAGTALGLGIMKAAYALTADRSMMPAWERLRGSQRKHGLKTQQVHRTMTPRNLGRPALR